MVLRDSGNMCACPIFEGSQAARRAAAFEGTAIADGAGSTRILAVDCSALLTRQLADLTALISRLRASRRGEDAIRLFGDLSNRAVLHVLSRERVLLPAWRQIRWKDLPLDAMAGHVRFKQALADLLVRPPSAEGHAEALGRFAQHVEQQRELDQHRLVPVLRGAMDIEQRRALCNDVELLFETGSPPMREPLVGSASPHDLIREAEIVLSSLAAMRPGAR
ncbi:MAG TPA: hypothetical protein VIP05_31315 [Burkholderiaceae bacterium]